MGHMRFDTLEGVDRFQRELDSFDVRYDKKLDITSEWLYCLRYDNTDYQKKVSEEIHDLYGVEF